MKQTLIWLNLQRDITGNGLSNTKDTFAESLQASIFSTIKPNSSVLFLAETFYTLVKGAN